jgi:DNA polymerase-3 subunit beta
LSAVKAEKILFELKDENSAVLLKPAADDDIQYMYVLMPMKI